METAEKQTLFETTMEMQKETLSKLMETGKKVTEMYNQHNPLRLILNATQDENMALPNTKDFKENVIKSAKILSKQVDTLSKYQRDRVRLFTKTQSEWLQNSETKVNKQWVEKVVEMNDFIEKSYADFDATMGKSFQNGFDLIIQHMEENTFFVEK
jgi:hypothetical protein